MGTSAVTAAAVNQAPARRGPGATRTFLAADVGGTHVRLGRVEHDGDPSRPPRLLDYRTYRCAEHSSLESILAEFLQRGPAIADVAIATAGFARGDGTVVSANLPWAVSPAAIRAALGLRSVKVVNDFEAVAHAVPQFDASTVAQLSGPPSVDQAPVLVLGPGTGLGAAVWIPNAGRPLVLATEAGQAALAAGSALEVQVLAQLHRQRRHVSIEHALSGPGLLNLYQALCALRVVAPTLTSPDAISAAANAGDDPLAGATLRLFCGLLGSVVGDLALLYGAHGGIYLAGGILPSLRQWLIDSDFVERFIDKGPMREVLRNIPVKLVEHGQLGVIGAARWYLDRDR